MYFSSNTISITVSDGPFMISVTRDVPRSEKIGGEEVKNFFGDFKKLSEKIPKFSKLGGVNDFFKNFYQFLTKFLKQMTKKNKIFQD